VVGGRTVTVAGQTWIFPSEAQCLNCHTAAAGHVLGLETAQQNGNFSYRQTGRTANQIVTLNAIQTLSPPITAAPSTLPALPDPFGTAPLAERARAYLHTNCSQCHRPSGPAPGALDFRYTTSLAGTNACNADPQQGSLGIGNARIIAAGEAQRSVLVARMNTRNADAMPPVASASIDTQGVQLMTQWINGLTACN
jgi:mono/diheme cytochrome c family protein